MNGHGSHPWSHLLFGAIGVLGKSAVPVGSKFVICVALEMIQLVVMCPALSTVMNQDLLVCRESCIPWFPLSVAERWCHRTNRH